MTACHSTGQRHKTKPSKKPSRLLPIPLLSCTIIKANMLLLQVDASDNGLDGALLQPNEHGKLQSMATTSCGLKETEQRYSQIEKKYFAVWNSFHKFDQWLYGKSDIEAHADHKPLKTKMMKPLNKAPSRLFMRLQPYRFSTTQRKGTSPHLADTISRAPLQTPVGVKVTKFEVFRS